LFRSGRQKPDHPALQYRALIAAMPQDPAQVVALAVGATTPTVTVRTPDGADRRMLRCTTRTR